MLALCYQTGIYAWLYRDTTLTAQSGTALWGSYGGSVNYQFSPTTLPTSGTGPWTYAAWGYHMLYSEDFDVFCPPYTDEWDGWDWGSPEVQRPTISGFLEGRGMWNLGPGSADPQLTWGGIYYYQSRQLTLNSNCNPSGACTATPQWHLPNNNQAQVSPTSGFTTTISKGSSRGNCQYNNVLTADIGGFSTPEYPIVVNSPTFLVNTGYNGTPREETDPWDNGYSTKWSLLVADACTPPNAIPPIPMNESFANVSNENGGTGYVAPPGGSWTWWDINSWDTLYTFVDNIGQSGYSQDPPVTHTVDYAPYTYSTVYLDATHYFNAGSTSSGDGWGVYNGSIRYYRDHGDNTQ